jgi:hypothetical protein
MGYDDLADNRTRAPLECPGTAANFTVIVSTAGQSQYGIGHPQNIGNCSLFLVALNDDGNEIEDLELIPRASRHWYWPPSGTAQIVAVCHKTCHGRAVLEFDTPVG